jgi:AcrR family transcriptional regulator
MKPMTKSPESPVEGGAGRTVRGTYAKTEGRRREIVAAATSVFSTNGYTGGSLRQIAKQLDLSLTSVTHHFPSKEILLEAVLEHANDVAREDFEQHRLEYGLVPAIKWIAEHNMGHPELLRLLAVLSAEASSPGHAAHEWFVNRYSVLRSLLVEAIAFDQARGLIDAESDPHATASAVLAALDGAQLQWLIDPRVDMVHVLMTIVSSVLRAPEGQEVVERP